MSSIFNENCVITGVAGSYCLLCQRYLTKSDLNVHITTPDHENNYKSSNYLANFEDDSIRKVNLGYYCEMCNMFIKTSPKVSTHVSNAIHITNKNYHLLEEIDDGVIAFGDTLIEKQSWNGVKDESCYICNVEYSDENDHTKESSHILNLIQSKLELKRNKFIYRKVEDSYLNCVTCNSLIPHDLKEHHVEEAGHVNNFVKCQERMKSLTVQNEVHKTPKVPNVPIKADLSEKKNVCKIEEDTKIENKSAQCNINMLNNLNETSDSILSPGAALKLTLQFAKENHLKYKRNNAYCKVCDVKISSSYKRMQEHVAEQAHKEKATGYTEVVHAKVEMNEFIKELTTAENLFGEYDIINSKYCITDESYHTLNDHVSGRKVRCQTCQVFVDIDEQETHKQSWSHVQHLQVTPILTHKSLATEFIRELRPGSYHCGFCNFTYSLDDLQSHLRSVNHSSTKTSMNSRLQEIIPGIIRERQKRHFFEIMKALHRRNY